MLWAAVTTAAVGLVMGLLFRAPAIFVASTVVALSSAVAGRWAELSALILTLVTGGLLIALQGGYLAGAVLRMMTPLAGANDWRGRSTAIPIAHVCGSPGPTGPEQQER
jgi:hypothetical protein